MERNVARGFVIAGIFAAAACATGQQADDTAFIGGEDAGPVIADDGSTGSTDGGQQNPPGTDSGPVTKPDAGNGNPGTDSGGPCAGLVVINEVQVAGGSASDEFVELYNPANCSVSLNMYTLGYYSAAGNGQANGDPIVMYVGGSGDTIAAHGFFVLGGSGYGGTVNGKSTADMAGAGGRVGIADGSGKLLDAVGYGTATAGKYVEKNPAPAPAANKSIGRKPDGTDSDSNSVDFTLISTPTPGKPN